MAALVTLRLLLFSLGHLGALGFWLLLQLRINLIDIYAYFQFDQWSFAAVHNFGFVILAMLWLGYVLLIEEYLRQGAERGQLLSRAIGIFLVVLTLLALSYVLQFLIIYD